MLEKQKDTEIIAAEPLERLHSVSPAVGEIAMPAETKKSYIHIVKKTHIENKSQQLVIESLAHEMDSYPVPVD
jgi:hypothetical protein